MASVAAGQGSFSNKARHKMLKAHNHALTQLRQKRRKKLKELDKQYKKKPETRPEDGGKAARAEISAKFTAMEEEMLESHAQEVSAFEEGAAAAAAAAAENSASGGWHKEEVAVRKAQGEKVGRGGRGRQT